jgi:hypothetical protein
MSRCILLKLPEAVSRLVLVEWLSIYELPELDSAFCDRELRDHFLTLAYSPYTVFTDALTQNSFYVDLDTMLVWLAVRKAHVAAIVINDELLRRHDLLLALLTVSGEAISWVKISSYSSDTADSSQQALFDIARCCPNVQHIDLQVASTGNGAILWDEHLVELTRSCRKIIDLSLCYTHLSEHGLATVFKNCACLQRISIRTRDQIIPADIAITSLKAVNCGYYCFRMSDGVLFAIGQRCAILETLTLFGQKGNHHVSDVGVRAILQGCPLLREIDVEYAEGISDDLRVELARRCSMTFLYFGGWLGINDQLAQRVLKVSPNLTVLRCVDTCDWLTDATLAVCAQHCPLIEDVTLPRCPLITNAGVRTLVSSLASKLRSVHLQNCLHLSEDALLAVAEHCPLLNKVVCSLDVSDAAVMKLAECCSGLSCVTLLDAHVGGVGLAALTIHCSTLAELHFFNCPFITTEGVRVRDVVTGCPRLKEITLPIRLNGEQLQLVEQKQHRNLIVRYT